MTHNEVTAAMRAEDAWVEKGTRAMWNAQTLPPWQQIDDGDEWPSWVDLATRDRLREKFRHALAAVLPLIVAKAFQDAADDTERYAAETYWRDDSPFHAQGRFHATEHAKRLRAGAAGWLITTTEEPTT